ncbi:MULTISPECIES: response regulator transcription factor [Asticcacaulis]|uniref:Response regulator transcription factor n=1 Tax=Asticcacaulis currens TaxID=2984210 RepID=A0ABT5IBV5_9CAUL|nr:response regulator transcription factor [Asticcacaulis currens]MDC7693662.1 response regulator transcription factor [Asticcacaulis currens]
MQVLLIEDDRGLGAGLKAALEQLGYGVDWVLTLDEALQALDYGDFAAALLDLGLPDGDGLSLLRRLRKRGHGLPILVITARSQRDTRLQALNDGADDYVTKPYDLDELLARLRAVIRRTRGEINGAVRFGVYELDIEGRIVRQEGRPIKLTAREFRVLSLLVTRAGRWVSKTDIENGIYDDATDVESNTVESAVYGLRKKLGMETIVSARGLGYMVIR